MNLCDIVLVPVNSKSVKRKWDAQSSVDVYSDDGRSSTTLKVIDPVFTSDDDEEEPIRKKKTEDDVQILKEITNSYACLEPVHYSPQKMVENPFYQSSEEENESSSLDWLRSEGTDGKTCDTMVPSVKEETTNCCYDNVKVSLPQLKFECYVKLPILPYKVNVKLSKICHLSFSTPTCKPSDVYLFTESSYFTSTSSIVDDEPVYLGCNISDVHYPKVGPLQGYEKVYDKVNKVLKEYKFRVDNDNWITVSWKNGFAMRYINFLKERITISSNPATQLEERKIPPEMEINSDKFFEYLEIESLNLNKLPEEISTLKQFSNQPDVVKKVAAFIQFCIGRQKCWISRRLGVKHMQNEIFQKRKFTNLARELDRGTQFFRAQLIPTLKQAERAEDILSEVLFKSCVYRLVNKVETFKQFGGIPDQKTLGNYLHFCQKVLDNNKPIFTAVHQNNGWTRYKNTLVDLQLKLGRICEKLRKCNTLSDACEVLKSVENIGDFFAWQILCDLTETNVIKVNDLDDWAELGPGARKGLKLIFGKSSTDILSILTTISKEADERVSWQLPPPIKINCKLVEHALCEFSKFHRYATEDGQKQLFRSRQHLDDTKCVICSIPTVSNKVLCILCNRTFHLSCINIGNQSHQNFCCNICEKLNTLVR